MAFHVTQCPGCDSTFNTNARILQSAAGKVRCGACLTVFEAADYFISVNDADEDEDSSVFVGNDPADYFDPTQFITRSALTAPGPLNKPSLTATASDEDAESVTPAPLVVATAAEQAADDEAESTTEADFLNAVAAELETADPAIAPAPASLPIADADIAAPPDPADLAASIDPADPGEAIGTSAPDAPTAVTDGNVATDPAVLAATAQHDAQDALPHAAEQDTTAEPVETKPTDLPASQPQPEYVRLHAKFSLDVTPPSLPGPRELFEITEITAATEAPQEPAELSSVDASDDSPAITEPQAPEEFAETVAAKQDAQDDESAAPQDATSDEFELIDLDVFEYVDVKIGDTFELEADTDADTEAQPVSLAAVARNADADATTTPDIGADQVETAAADSDDSTESIRARAFRAILRDDDALEALPQESRAAIGKVLPPVELFSGIERHWGRRLLLALACLVLAATLAAQFLWQRLPIYSRTAEWRPVYEFACRVMSCELPVYSEISAIQSDNLVVRSHPTEANALSVSLSFRNTARFPQPFPILILSFNSATNAIIALRELAPTEYLGAALRDLQLMPAMSPVQIEIDIMDPGADAVNYTVAFRRP